MVSYLHIRERRVDLSLAAIAGLNISVRHGLGLRSHLTAWPFHP